MTAKEFLRQYEYLTKRIIRLEIEYEKEMLMIDAIRSASDNDGMPHGSSISKATEDKAIRITDKAIELFNTKLEAIETRQRIFEVIDQLEGIEADVLYERYINLKIWEEVCESVYASWFTVHNAHSRGLEKVQEILNNTSIYI